MAGLDVKSFGNPDESRVFEKGRADIVTLGDVTLARTTLEPGWRWSEHVRPLAGTASCQVHHMGFVVRGRTRIVLDDGTSQEVGPEEVYNIPAGHDAWVVGDETLVSFDWAGSMGSFAKPVINAADRVITTLLVTDIVGSTAIAERIGDAEWHRLLARHNQAVRKELDRYRGREVSTTGDGFLATFDGAARAVQCAAAICEALVPLNLTIRTGIHTGEVEYAVRDVRGVSVHVAARIAGLAQPSEVLVSSVTHDLLAGSGLQFEDRGAHELKGLSGARHVYSFVRDTGEVTG
jgi:class 3 adenylate cyclase